jgi:hypothetical protein
MRAVGFPAGDALMRKVGIQAFVQIQRQDAVCIIEPLGCEEFG